ncbi:hypothetical protein LINGRAHAP2_LOCUS21715 [Linum grandiflorum]
MLLNAYRNWTSVNPLHRRNWLRKICTGTNGGLSI